MTLIDLANPTRFLALTARVLPWLAGATVILLAIGLYLSALAPDDYQQGATVKIMFIHVPNAWLAMFVWGVMSIASLGKEVYDQMITINGFSKAYSMTGWRIGYTAAPQEIAAAIDTIQSHTTSNVTTFAQYGAIAALNGDQQVVADMREEFNVRREFMLDRLGKIKNVRVVEPNGAFYFLVNIEPIGIRSVNFAEKLLSKQKVAVVPGIAFGSDFTVRFSYATSLDVINAGMDRFEEFCNQH